MSDSASTEQLSTDVQNAIRSAEDMFQQAASAGGDKAAELRERAMEQLRTLREKLHDAQDSVVESSKAAARATDDFVHDHPWKSIGTAAAVGVLIGLLLNRR
ncbi:MAG: YqjD family protein [Ideonella sp.]